MSYTSDLAALKKLITDGLVQTNGKLDAIKAAVDKLPAAPAPTPVPVPVPVPPTAQTDAQKWGIPDLPEIRPQNAKANQTRGHFVVTGKQSDEFTPYFNKIDGNFVGTTGQILMWAAKKWKFDELGFPEIFLAQACIESWWNQDVAGDGGVSFGLLQIKSTVWSGSPEQTELLKTSSAYGADFGAAILRAHIDGALSWTRSFAKDNIYTSLAVYYSGSKDGVSGGGAEYADKVLGYLKERRWEMAGF